MSETVATAEAEAPASLSKSGTERVADALISFDEIAEIMGRKMGRPGAASNNVVYKLLKRGNVEAVCERVYRTSDILKALGQ